MIARVAALKAACRRSRPVPDEFSQLNPSKTSYEKLLNLYTSPKFLQILPTSAALQREVFATSPPAPVELLKYASPNSVSMAIRCFLFNKDLDSAFNALKYLPKTNYTSFLPGCGLLSIGIISAIVWMSPVGVLICGYWSGLAAICWALPEYRYVQYRAGSSLKSSNSQILAHADHIVAWYEDYLGVSTENWHRRRSASVSEAVLTSLLADHNLERRARPVDMEYADYWGHKETFDWVEPDQDPAYFIK